MNIGLITVVVPVYNVESYVEKCIESLIDQTYTDIEIILVDDGSTDRSGSICDDYSLRDQRITVFHKSNGGLSDARNYGIVRAHGRHISFVDSDDTVSPYYIEDLILDEGEDYISICHPFRVYEDREQQLPKHEVDPVKREYTPIEAERMFLQSNVFVSAWGKLYPTKIFRNIRYPIGEINEDKGTTYKLYAEVSKVYEIQQSNYFYLIRGNSLSSTKYLDKQLAIIDRNLSRQQEFFDKTFGKGVFDKDIQYKRLTTYLYFIFHISMSDSPEKYTDIKKEMVKYVDQYKIKVLFDPLSTKRTKMACLAFLFGEKVYTWLYSLIKEKR